MKKERSAAERKSPVVFCVIVFVGMLLLRRATAPLFVSLFAFLVARLVDPPARRLSERTGRSREFWAVLFAVLLFLGVGILLGWLGAQIKAECQKLLLWLSEHKEEASLWTERISIRIKRALSKLPLGASAGTEKLFSVWETMTNSLGERLLSFATGVIGGVPRLFLFSVISVIATLYLCVDYERIKKAARRLIPESLRDRIRLWKNRVLSILWIYVRASCLLAGLAFLEVSVGLWILGIPYPFLLALGIALIDLLPVLGAGAVLIPWGLFSLATGNGRVGWGLLVLYAVLLISRQLAEPKLIGKTFGLPPFVSLMSMLFGFCFFGFIGMLFGPLIALFLKEWMEKTA